ncbi:MAG TPA: elongation factor G [Deinococcales bacterium]|nr:elongation factor G [Deinococcales bacterium]
MRVRNVAVVSHSGAGKTSLVEALLYRTGARDRLGRIEDGTTASDHTESEKRRKISISTSVLPVQWKGTTINLLDTPGYSDFVGEIRGAMRAADSALVVVSAVSGVAVGTERVWRTADDFAMPRIVVINKMDRERADFYGTLKDVHESLPGSVAAAYLPVGSEASFRGVVDLLARKACYFEKGEVSEGEVPAEVAGLAEDYRSKLVDAIVETDEELMELYLGDEEISDERLHAAYMRAVHAGQLFPVIPTSATTLVGLEPLLELMAEGLRAPDERQDVIGEDGSSRRPVVEEKTSARIWRNTVDPFVGKVAFVRVWSGRIKPGETIRNTSRDTDIRPAHVYALLGKELIEVPELHAGMIGAITKIPELRTGDTLADPSAPINFGPLELPDTVTSVALHAATRADEDKLGTAMNKLLEEDPTLRFERHPETFEMLLSGMGHVHLEIAVEKLGLMGVKVESTTPKIPYRETVRAVASAQGKHKKQSGGHGQYGDCWLRIEPSDKDFEFASEVVGGVIPTKYIPSVEKGVVEAKAKGALSGYPVQNIKVVVYDGSYHDVDSSDIAFKTAAGIGFRAAMEKARPCLLEPVMLLRVRVPERFTGEIISDLQTRRARIQGMEPEGAVTTVSALVPLAEIQNYSPDLRSLTSGRGVYSLKFDSYAEVPHQEAEKIIAARKAELANA